MNPGCQPLEATRGCERSRRTPTPWLLVRLLRVAPPQLVARAHGQQRFSLRQQTRPLADHGTLGCYSECSGVRPYHWWYGRTDVPGSGGVCSSKFACRTSLPTVTRRRASIQPCLSSLVSARRRKGRTIISSRSYHDICEKASEMQRVRRLNVTSALHPAVQGGQRGKSATHSRMDVTPKPQVHVRTHT